MGSQVLQNLPLMLGGCSEVARQKGEQQLEM